MCEFPADYPNTVAPILEVVVTKGLSLDRGDELLLVAQNAANENIGLPSIFTIAELVKEWLVDNNIPGQDGSMYSGNVVLYFEFHVNLHHHQICCVANK